MGRKKKQKKENSERWLLTYSDLITLLMILFILLYSMSVVDQTKYEQLSAALSGSLGSGASILGGTSSIIDGGNSILDGSTQVTETQTAEVTANDTTEVTTENTTAGNSTQTVDTATGITNQADMQDIKEHIDDMLAKYNSSGDITSFIGDSGLVITFSDNVFFDSGDDKLKEKMKKSLDQITVMINKIDNPILVEGNADNVPVKNNKFSSNWQLSATRAANVVQYLVDIGHVDGSRLSAIGFGEYQPVDTNDTAAGRSHNRRIDITILYNPAEGIHE